MADTMSQDTEAPHIDDVEAWNNIHKTVGLPWAIKNGRLDFLQALVSKEGVNGGSYDSQMLSASRALVPLTIRKMQLEVRHAYLSELVTKLKERQVTEPLRDTNQSLAVIHRRYMQDVVPGFVDDIMCATAASSAGEKATVLYNGRHYEPGSAALKEVITTTVLRDLPQLSFENVADIEQGRINYEMTLKLSEGQVAVAHECKEAAAMAFADLRESVSEALRSMYEVQTSLPMPYQDLNRGNFAALLVRANIPLDTRLGGHSLVEHAILANQEAITFWLIAQGTPYVNRYYGDCPAVVITTPGPGGVPQEMIYGVWPDNYHKKLAERAERAARAQQLADLKQMLEGVVDTYDAARGTLSGSVTGLWQGTTAGINAFKESLSSYKNIEVIQRDIIKLADLAYPKESLVAIRHKPEPKSAQHRFVCQAVQVLFQQGLIKDTTSGPSPVSVAISAHNRSLMAENQRLHHQRDAAETARAASEKRVETLEREVEAGRVREAAQASELSELRPRVTALESRNRSQAEQLAELRRERDALRSKYKAESSEWRQKHDRIRSAHERDAKELAKSYRESMVLMTENHELRRELFNIGAELDRMKDDNRQLCTRLEAIESAGALATHIGTPGTLG